MIGDGVLLLVSVIIPRMSESESDLATRRYVLLVEMFCKNLGVGHSIMTSCDQKGLALE